MRFSEYFDLKKSQAELDFVDIPLDTDIKLFVDPYAISIVRHPWFIECNNLLVDFFETLIAAIKRGNKSESKHLLSNLGEVNNTHLGLSKGTSQGSGIGQGLSDSLYNAIVKSKAVRTGNLQDFSDFELFIDGISHDRISDMTINVIKSKLVEYTFQQCNIFEIPTAQVPVGPCWNSDEHRWESRFADLPVSKKSSIILVPKSAARFNLAFSQDEYYSKFVLEYLQAEHLNAGSSLVRTLKTSKKQVVYKKDLKEEHPKTKEMLLDFSQDHPEILARYKHQATQKMHPLLDEQIEEGRRDPQTINYREMYTNLTSIPAGRKDADSFHTHIIGVLQAIFYPGITHPKKETPLHSGRKKIDVVFNNGDDGFFHRLSTTYRITAPFIFIECKNYNHDVKNPEFDQLTGRFSEHRGKFGILVCRNIDDKEAALARCQDIAKDDRGFVLILEDNDIKTLLHLRQGHKFKEIESFLDKKMRELLL